MILFQQKRRLLSPASPITKRSRRTGRKRVVSVPIERGGGSAAVLVGVAQARAEGHQWIAVTVFAVALPRVQQLEGVPGEEAGGAQPPLPRRAACHLLVGSQPSVPGRNPRTKFSPTTNLHLHRRLKPTIELAESEHKFVEQEVKVETPVPSARKACSGEERFECFDQTSLESQSMALYAPAFEALDVALPPPLPEEWDHELQGEDARFAGLGKLLECAFVFRRRHDLGLGAAGAISACGDWLDLAMACTARRLSVNSPCQI